MYISVFYELRKLSSNAKCMVWMNTPSVWCGVQMCLFIPIKMLLCASTGPVLDQCCQHRPSTDPVLPTNGCLQGYEAKIMQCVKPFCIKSFFRVSTLHLFILTYKGCLSWLCIVHCCQMGLNEPLCAGTGPVLR